VGRKHRDRIERRTIESAASVPLPPEPRLAPSQLPAVSAGVAVRPLGSWSSSDMTPYPGPIAPSEAEAVGQYAIRRCVTIIADAIAGRDWSEWRGRQRLEPSRLTRRPCGSMSRRDWTWRVTATLALYDTAYLWMVGGVDAEGVPWSLLPVPPAVIAPRGPIDPYGIVPPTSYQVGSALVSSEQLAIVRRAPWPTPDPFMSGLLQRARVTLASALAADRYAWGWWAEGGAPGTVITTDQELSTVQADAIADRWLERRAGNRRPAVLGKGASAKPYGADPTTESAVEARREITADVARLFGVPPHLVNAPMGTSLTYATAESNAMDLIRYTLWGYSDPITDVVSELLPGDYLVGRRIRLDFSDLTVGDMGERFTAYATATGNKAWMSPREVRELEGLDPELPAELEPEPVPEQLLAPPADPGEPPPADPGEPPPADGESILARSGLILATRELVGTSQSIAVGSVQLRSIDPGSPELTGRILEGLAVPFGVPYDIAGQSEAFAPGAFRAAIASWSARSDNGRVPYLSIHSDRGGVAIGAVTHLWEAPDGLRFRAELIDTQPARDHAAQVRAGVNGVSIEFVPQEVRNTGPTAYLITRARLLAIAGVPSPAYDSARVSVRRHNSGGSSMRCNICGQPAHPAGTTCPMAPADFGVALADRLADAQGQVASITAGANAEARELTDIESTELAAAESRVTRLTAQQRAYVDQRARVTAERDAAARAQGGRSVPASDPGGRAPILATRSEPVYRGAAGVSYYADMYAAAQGDRAASERLGRHRQLVAELRAQLETRAVDSGDLTGSWPTQYMPDLYVPDTAYNGPMGGFFREVPISDPRPINIPRFSRSKLIGDTGPQSAENAPLPSVEVGTDPIAATPVTIGGETIVSRQSLDGAAPGIDLIVTGTLRELQMRDRERAIATVLAALPVSGTITDTAGTTPAQSGRDLIRGLSLALARYYGGGTDPTKGRFLPAEGVLTNPTDYEQLVQAEDLNGRPLMPFLGPVNASGTFAAGYEGGTIAGRPVYQAWGITSQLDTFIARRNDAIQWISPELNMRLDQREGPQSVVFAIWQYFAFGVIQPIGVQRWTYTNTLMADAESAALEARSTADREAARRQLDRLDERSSSTQDRLAQERADLEARAAGEQRQRGRRRGAQADPGDTDAS
jgi:HK97 family phage portal protein/HK97 family phage prohead protease